MAKRGQPTKLTPAVQDAICKLIAATGCTIEGAATAVDVDPSTVSRWRTRGMVEGKGLYFNFYKALMHARAKSETTLLAYIATGAKTDWRAAAWLLERRFPDQYGNRLTLVRRLEQMTEDELDAALAERLAGAGLRDEDDAPAQIGAGAGSAATDTEP